MTPKQNTLLGHGHLSDGTVIHVTRTIYGRYCNDGNYLEELAMLHVSKQLELFWGCLVVYFKRKFSLFKQYYTYFYTL